MKLSRSTSETRVFVLSWTSLEQLYSSIEARLPKVSITAKCADQLDREFTSLQELKEFSNPSRAAIKQLKITGRDLEHDQRFSISLSNERGSNVRIMLEANEENALPLNEFASDTVESLVPWYSWVARVDWYWLVLGGWLATQLALAALKLVLAGEKAALNPSTSVNALEALKIALTSFAPVMVGIGLNFVRDRFFPMGTFAIGQGTLRHSKAEVVRTVWIAGLAVSTVVSVVVSWFS